MTERFFYPSTMIRLLEIHTRKTVFEGEVDRQLIEAGLIEHDAVYQCYGTSEMGKKLIQMWEETPLPVQVWVDPRKVESK